MTNGKSGWYTAPLHSEGEEIAPKMLEWFYEKSIGNLPFGGPVQSSNLVQGAGISIGFIDTGCYVDHVGLSGRVDSGSFFGEHGNGGSGHGDLVGHGTGTAGISCSSYSYVPGVAPKARVVPLKVDVKQTSNDTIVVDFDNIAKALESIVDEEISTDNITVVNLSLGDFGNHTNLQEALDASGSLGVANRIVTAIRTLRNKRVPVVVAAGNSYKCLSETAGMNFPAIVPEAISVGAVVTGAKSNGYSFDANYCGAIIGKHKKNWIASFSQRLPLTDGSECATTVMALGAPLKILGNSSPQNREENKHGTSLAAPMVSGIIALLQEKFRILNNNDELPTVDQLVNWLQNDELVTDDPIDHGDTDNVAGTGGQFYVADADLALSKLTSEFAGF